MTVNGVTSRFSYDASNALTTLASNDGTDVTVYVYDQGLLATETQTQTKGVTTTRYEYGDNLVTAAINQDGTEEAYEYTLDDRGFVQFAKLLNPVTDVSLPTHYSYDYTNCHLHWRIAYDKNDSINLDATVEYSYDALGQVTERKSLIADELFDYSCW